MRPNVQYILVLVLIITAFMGIQYNLSQTTITKDKHFRGINIALNFEMGAAKHFIIEVAGPKFQYKISQKEQKFGLWSKKEALITKKISSYQFIATDLDANTIERIAKSLSIDLYGKKLSFVNQEALDSLEMGAAINVLFKNQKAAMSYLTRFNQSKAESLTSIEIPMQPNVMPGDYNVKIYLLNDKIHIFDTMQATISVDKDEFYYRLEEFSINHPSIYALISILLTYIIGFTAHLLLKKKI